MATIAKMKNLLDVMSRAFPPPPQKNHALYSSNEHGVLVLMLWVNGVCREFSFDDGDVTNPDASVTRIREIVATTPLKTEGKLNAKKHQD